MKTKNAPRLATRGADDEQPGGHAVASTVPRRYAIDRLMRERGSLPAVPVPPALHQLARRRTAEVAA